MSNLEKLKKEIENRAKDGKITCSECHKLAEDLGVSLDLVGQTADALKIKIYKCQLGCF